MSPVAWQPSVPPAVAQRPFTHVSEQHSGPEPQAFPSVAQVAPTTGAHVVPSHRPLQQSPFCVQVAPFVTQPATVHVPPVQLPVQQVSLGPQVRSAAMQPAGVTQVCEPLSQVPAQQPSAPEHVAPIGTQVGASTDETIGASAVPVVSGASPPALSMLELPQATTRRTANPQSALVMPWA